MNKIVWYRTCLCKEDGTIIEVGEEMYPTAEDAEAVLATWVRIDLSNLWYYVEDDGSKSYACVMEDA